jgi:Pentapeptide repeats (8 copies)
MEAARLEDENGHGKFSSRIKKALDATKGKARKLSDEADWVFGRRTVRVLCAVALFAIVVALLLVFLDWYIAPTKASDKKDLVLAMAQILAGTALLSGLYFTWRTLQVNREGQITERFTRAIEQLGATHGDNSDNLELRLGGIYALEHIARESEKDHWSIMEILTAYVRQHAPWRPEEAQQVEEDVTVEKNSEEDSRRGAETTEVSDLDAYMQAIGYSEPTEVPAPAADIRAIMTVIGRRTLSFNHGEPEHLDLRKTNLSGADLSEANLTAADLSGAKLIEANLTGADLPGADLSSAHLENANLRMANLSGANFSEARLLSAHLENANLSGAKSLTPKQLEETFGNENTQLPPYLEPPTYWDIWTDD